MEAPQHFKRIVVTAEVGLSTLLPEYYFLARSTWHSAHGNPREVAVDLAGVLLGKLLSAASKGADPIPHGGREHGAPPEPLSLRPESPRNRFYGTSQGDIALNPDVGLSRELRVAEEVGGRVTRIGNTDLAIKVPSDKYIKITTSRPHTSGPLKDVRVIQAQPGDTVKIDVLGPNQEIITVGGPAKAIKISDLGGTLKRQKALADWHNVKALAYFAEGTSKEVLDLARKWLGDNVRVFK